MKIKKEKQEKKAKSFIEDMMETDSMKLFTMISSYYLLVLIVFSIMQLLNIINLSVVQILSISIPIIIYLLIKNNQSNKKKLITIIIYLLITIAIPFTYNKIYDVTQDGNSYHKSAIAFIKNGWNPLYESMRSFQKKNSNVIELSEKCKIDLWSEHYPKATWIIAAVIYEMTGNIESGKCITLVISIMFMILVYNCLRKIIDKKWSFILSLLFILNPIVLAQIFSYYVDGIMGICFAIEILILMCINPKEKINYKLIVSLVSIICIFVNLKYTGLLCSGIIAAIYYLFWLIKYRKEKDYLSIIKRITLVFVVAFFSAVFIVGSNSYVKNTIDHHNPLYPLIGKDKVDIITTMQPKSFKNKSHIEKFVISMFSRTENTTYEKEPRLKLPIRPYRAEIDELYIPDVRLGGFGPLFALAFIITILLFIPAAFILYKKEKENLKYVILPFISIIISMILVGESWWARYVPQLYYISIGTILLILYLSKYYKNIIFKLLPFILIIPIAINVGCFIYVDYDELKIFKTITSDIKELKKRNNPKLKLTNYDLYGYLYTLNDNNVKYTLVDELKDEEKVYMYSWRLEVKRDDKELSKTN